MNELYVKCPICGIEKQKLYFHIKKVHNINKEQFKELYPNNKLESEECNKVRRQASKDSYTNEMRKQHSELGKENFIKYNTSKEKWSGENGERLRKIVSDNYKKIGSNPEVIIKQSLARIGSHSKTRSQSLKNKWKDPEYANKVIHSSSLSRQGLKQYDNGKFRSSWESKLAKTLNELNIIFIYEGLDIKYYDRTKNKERTYVTDFYINSINLIIEVKPSGDINNINVQDKMLACLDKGYNFLFITEKELFKKDFKNWLLKRCNDYRKLENLHLEKSINTCIS